MKHDELVKIAGKWLKNQGCGYVATELKALTPNGEIPDAIGFRSDYSVIVECKASRSDFLADRKKIFRKVPEMGMGDFRFFMCPDGMIHPSDLPEKWGLLHVTEKGRVNKIVAPKGNIWKISDLWHREKSVESEYALMYSCLRRKTVV